MEQEGRSAAVDGEIFEAKQRKRHALQTVVVIGDCAKGFLSVLGVKLILPLWKVKSYA